MSTEPVPQRLSDADRDAAVTMLREHFEAGRLTQPEFDERMGLAFDARFGTDLAPLFNDLPEPRPAASAPAPALPAIWTPAPSLPAAWTPTPDAVATSSPTPFVQVLGVVRALVWPAALVLWFATGQFWWMVAAFFISVAANQLGRTPRTPPPGIDR